MAEGAGSNLDPLSSATRATKRNLLGTSTLSIAIKAFDINIEHVDVLGVEVDAAKGALTFILLAAQIYFLLSFLVYYVVDFLNIEPTPHQERAASDDSEAIDRYRAQWEVGVRKAVSLAADGWSTSVDAATMAALQRRLEG
ncbi:MAG: hypothetical protein WAM62_07705, partial [Pseudolabrys sp.]